MTIDWTPWPTPAKIRVPVSKPQISSQDMASVSEVLSRSDVSLGAETRMFEEEFGEYVNSNALAVSNGSVALILALKALGIGPGDEVIVPSLTFAATASSVIHVGATPVFVDVSPDHWTVQLPAIEEAHSQLVKAIIPVHIYGLACDIKQLGQWAASNDVRVIEDSAEALGGSHNGEPVGGSGDFSTWSLYGNKVITSGEGGIVTTRDPRLYSKARSLRGQGMSPSRRYFFDEAGYNFRMSNVAGALALSQWRSISSKLLDRRRVFDSYKSLLGEYVKTPTPLPNTLQAPWQFTASIPGFSYEQTLQVAQHLASRGVETRPVFYPLPDMPAFRQFKSYGVVAASQIASSSLSLPTFPQLSESDICFVASTVIEGISKVRRQG